MSKGHSFESFGGVVLAGRRTLYDWADRHEEFKVAKDVGQACAMLRHEERLFDSDANKSEVTSSIFALKTRFHKIYGDPEKNKEEKDTFLDFLKTLHGVKNDGTDSSREKTGQEG